MAIEARPREELELWVKKKIVSALRRLYRDYDILRLWRDDEILENWSDEIQYLAQGLVLESSTLKELREKLREILDALPAYVWLVEKLMNLEDLWHLYEDTVALRMLEIFRSLIPLSKGRPRCVGQPFGDGVCVGEWVHVYDSLSDSYRDIEQRLSLTELPWYFAEFGSELVEHIEDEEKREVFGRLCELAGQLKVDRRICERDELGREVCVYPKDPRFAVIGGEGSVYVYALDDLPSLIPIMGTLERLYDRLEEELGGALERSESVLGEMKKVALPYVLDRILG